MAKFQAIGNYKISVPPQISGNIHNFLRYDQIAQAGAPQSLLGEAIYGIGSGIAQMFEDEFKPEKKDVKEEEKDDFVPTTNDPTPFDPNTVKIDTTLEDEEDEAELDKILNPPIVDNPIDEPPKDPTFTIFKDPKFTETRPRTGQFGAEGSDRLVTDRQDLKHREEYEKALNLKANQNIDASKFNIDFNNILGDINKNKQNSELFGTNKNLKNARLNINPLKIKRLKDDNNPIKRLKDSGADDKTANHILQILQGFSYPYKNTEYDTPLRRVAHAENSPFLKTDSLKYREMREMTYDPRKRGSIETAFQEAFNVQIDKYNYSQKVKADFEKEVGDEVGSLVVDVDNLDDTWKKSILDTSQRMKSQLYNDYIDYINGNIDKATYESKKLGYQAEINELSNANAKLLEGGKAFFENKHLIDPDASDSNVVDFWNTREKAPENIAIKTAENGVKYYVGKTINGEDFQLPVRQIANGTSGMNLVMKANLAPDITKIVGGMKKIQEQEILKGGYAMANIPADDPRMQDFAKSQLMAVLNDENVLRSAASTYGGLNSDAYATTIQDSDDREALKRDLVDQIYNEVVVPQYVPERKQTVGTTRSRGGNMTAAERKRMQIKQRFDNLAPLSESTINQYNSQLDNTKYVLKKDEKGFYIGNIKDKTRITLSSNPAEAKTQIANYAGVTGYTGQTYDAKSLIAQYSN